MASLENISVALPSEMAAVVRQAVEDGEFASSSEAVADAISDWTKKRTSNEVGVSELQRLWQEAVATEAPGVPAEEVLSRLERKYQAMVGPA